MLLNVNLSNIFNVTVNVNDSTTHDIAINTPCCSVIVALSLVQDIQMRISAIKGNYSFFFYK